MIARLLSRIFALIAPKPVAGIKPQTQPLSDWEKRTFVKMWSGK